MTPRTTRQRRDIGFGNLSTATRWIAGASLGLAGQCGPCANDPPAIAAAFASLISGDRRRPSRRPSRPVVAHGGRPLACKLPDGCRSE